MANTPCMHYWRGDFCKEKLLGKILSQISGQNYPAFLRIGAEFFPDRIFPGQNYSRTEFFPANLRIVEFYRHNDSNYGQNSLQKFIYIFPISAGRDRIFPGQNFPRTEFFPGQSPPWYVWIKSIFFSFWWTREGGMANCKGGFCPSKSARFNFGLLVTVHPGDRCGEGSQKLFSVDDAHLTPPPLVDDTVSSYNHVLHQKPGLLLTPPCWWCISAIFLTPPCTWRVCLVNDRGYVYQGIGNN